MIGAGTIISPIIKIVTTVAILAAIYFLIIRPVLDTTEDITNQAFESFELPDNIAPDVERSIDKAFNQAEKAQDQAASSSSAQIRNAEKLLDCINNASGDVNKISACNAKFSP